MAGANPNWLSHLLSIFGADKPKSTWHDRLPEEGLSDSDRFLIDALPYERVETTGNEAMAVWARLRDEGKFYPIIVGCEENLIRLVEQWGLDDRSPQDILSAAEQLDHPNSLFALRESETERAREYLAQMGERLDEDYQAPFGDWPDLGSVEPNLGPSIVRDPRSGEPLDKVHLLLMPVRHGYEVPAFLRWGGWNECPPPEHHVAALHHWHSRYGAELVAISGDVIELRVATKPLSPDEGIGLAREQYCYCSDIVDQGVEDIATLAAILMASDWWYFWWD